MAFERIRAAYQALSDPTDRQVRKAMKPSGSASIPGTLSPVLPKPKPFEEIGVSGLLRTKGVGFLYEEFLPELSAQRAKLFWREMRDNDPVIGAMFFALEMILRKAEWRIEPNPEGGKDADKYADFVESCREDLSHTWQDFIAECVSQYAFGFALFETVYKRRKGEDGRSASKFDDGLIGWRKFAPRSQESILYWIWDEGGGLQGAVQLAAPDYHTVSLPIEKLLLFRTTSLKNNPEGRSILRNCFRPWFFKRRIEEIEGIGIERDLCGLPVIYTTGEGMIAANQMGINYNDIVRNIRRDDQEGVVLPNAYDEKGNPHVKLELLKGAGARQIDVNATIRRYNQDMLNSMLAGFIQLGDGDVGSWALASSKTRIFSIAIGAFMDSTAAVINRIAIPRLMKLNNMDTKQAPRLVPGDIEVRDLEELGAFVQRLAASGLTFFDKPTADYLRKQAHLPESPEEDESAPPLVPGMQPGQPPAKGGAPMPPGSKPPDPKDAPSPKTPMPKGPLKPGLQASEQSLDQGSAGKVEKSGGA